MHGSMYIDLLERTTEQIYATTIHELAHASHWGDRGVTTMILNHKKKESMGKRCGMEVNHMII